MVSGAEVITLGCRLNLAESEAMRVLAGADADDLVIVNSCAVTNEAVRQTRQAIRRAKRARPGARVVVTGCAAQVDPKSFAAMPEVSRVLGNVEKLLPDSFVPSEVEARCTDPETRPSTSLGTNGLFHAAPADVRVSDIMAVREKLDPDSFAAMPEVTRVIGTVEKLLPDSFVPSEVEARCTDSETRPSTSLGTNGLFHAAPAEIRVSDIMAVRENAPHLAASFSDRTRAFVEVQNGCDHRCTFCIIPYGRGNSRSVPAGLVVDRIKAIVAEGAREVVLTGVDVTSYGPDLPGRPSLGLLVERILRHVPDLPRLRLSSLDCIELDERLFDIASGEPRFMPHLHMSFQAGDDMVLKRMKRRHSRAQAVETVARLKERRPDIAIGADLIAGFPTETEAMHENSLRLIDECDIVMGHIFPYSPKAGTPAARMPQVAPQVVKARARRLREAAARRRAAWLAGMVGTTQKVLVERGGTGHAENFAPVRITGARSSRAKSRGADDDSVQRASTALGTNEVGKVRQVTIIGVEGGTLIGAPL
jgi:threonylcarbamoyladenosine tRNA methylthiotransferase MtaB